MRIVAIVGLISLTVGCAASTDNSHQTPTPLIGQANPAATYCLKLAGQLTSVQTDSGVSSLCHLPSGEVIDEWSLYYRDHPRTDK